MRRYRYFTDIGMDEEPDGEYVRFEDIKAVVQEAYRNGKKEGAREGYNQGYAAGRSGAVDYRGGN